MTERSGFLFCADPLRASRPDPQFAEDVAAARAAGPPCSIMTRCWPGTRPGRWPGSRGTPDRTGTAAG